MKPGDRVVFSGRVGTVVRSMPGQMIDIKFDDAPQRIERRSLDRLARAKMNPARRPRRARARRNPSAVSLLEGTEFNTAMLHVAFSRLGMTDDEFVEEAEGLLLADRVKLAQSLVDAAFGGSAAGLDKTAKAEKEREQESAAKRVKPKAKAYTLDIDSKLGGRNAVTFVENDPLRVSADQTELCGNPIDGQAYYLLVSTQRRFTPSWLSQSTVFAAARAAGVQPSKESDTFKAWLRTYFDALTENNVDWYAHRQSARQIMRVKGMGLPANLARKEASAKHPGMEPNQNVDFWMPDTDGTPVFFRINASENPGAEALKRFQLFAARRFVLPDPMTLPAQLVQQFGTLAVGLHMASQQVPELEPRGIAPELCRQLIVSGCVQIEYTIEGGRYARKERVPELNPTVSYTDGARARIYAPEKSASPLYSWVRSFDPVRQPGSTVPACLSAVERATVEALRQLDSTLGQLEAAFGRTRSLFARLVEQPESLRTKGDWHDVYKSVAGLSRAYTAVLRWWGAQLDQANFGSAAARAALDAFSATALQPMQQSSVLNQALGKLRSGISDEGSLYTGLAPADWLIEVVPKTSDRGFQAKLERRVEKLRAAGYEAQVANAVTGTIQYRVPMAKMKPEITDFASYDSFMRLLDSSARAELMPASAGSLGRPGMAALTYLASAAKKQTLTSLPPDPADDLYLFVEPSLLSEQKERLLEARQDANDVYRAAVFTYAVGGLMTPQGPVDPLNKHEPFFLLRPAAWPVSFEQQLDVNWGIGFVFDRLLTHGYAACYEVLLLVFLYDLLFGYELAGPLRPDVADTSPHLIQVARKAIKETIAGIMGGSRGLAQSGRFDVYVTYNPVLFEVTRQYWPDRRTGREVSTFTSVLALPALAHAIDAAGHYGFVLGQTQRAALFSASEEDVQQHLAREVARVSGLQPDWLLKRLAVNPDTEELYPAPEGYYASFFLFWRLGQPVYGAGEAAHVWTTEPLEYISSVKPALEQSVSTALQQRRAKVGQLHEDLPFLYPDVGIPTESAVYVPDDEVQAINWRVQAVQKELERRQKGQQR